MPAEWQYGGEDYDDVSGFIDLPCSMWNICGNSAFRTPTLSSRVPAPCWARLATFLCLLPTAKVPDSTIESVNWITDFNALPAVLVLTNRIIVGGAFREHLWTSHRYFAAFRFRAVFFDGFSVIG